VKARPRPPANGIPQAPLHPPFSLEIPGPRPRALGICWVARSLGSLKVSLLGLLGIGPRRDGVARSGCYSCCLLLLLATAAEETLLGWGDATTYVLAGELTVPRTLAAPFHFCVATRQVTLSLLIIPY